MKYQLLTWDSDFFGIKVAKINQATLQQEDLAKLLSQMKNEKIDLIYWPTAKEQKSVPILQRYSGALVDQKVTFVIPLQESASSSATKSIVEVYTESMPFNDLESLAVQSGSFSRFSIDKHISNEKFEELYKIWIKRSLQKEIAEQVLVIREERQVVGMITVTKKNKRGEIGLLAVDKNSRGKKYGQLLIKAAQKWFIQQGITTGQVVTQGMNYPACALYQKCGYGLEKTEYYYHFWPQLKKKVFIG